MEDQVLLNSAQFIELFKREMHVRSDTGWTALMMLCLHKPGML